MSDLISRQAAIDALKEHRALFCDNTPNTFSKLSYAEKSRVDELDMAIATIINLPSAQPERTDCTECEEYDHKTKSCPYYCEVIRKTADELQVEASCKLPERKTGRWIPCSERLPEAEVLCCDKRGEMIIGYPYQDDESNTGYSAVLDDVVMIDCIAWIPLPECYREGD